MKKVLKGIFIVVGFLFLGLGVLGVVLPILPATPFLVVAAICFARGSEKFHNWFINTGLYKKYVEPAVNKKAMEKSAKRKTLTVLCLIFTTSFFVVPVWPAKIVILLVALFHIYYFTFKIRTVQEETAQ